MISKLKMNKKDLLFFIRDPLRHGAFKSATLQGHQYNANHWEIFNKQTKIPFHIGCLGPRRKSLSETFWWFERVPDVFGSVLCG